MDYEIEPNFSFNKGQPLWEKNTTFTQLVYVM